QGWGRGGAQRRGGGRCPRTRDVSTAACGPPLDMTDAFCPGASTRHDRRLRARVGIAISVKGRTMPWEIAQGIVPGGEAATPGCKGVAEACVDEPSTDCGSLRHALPPNGTQGRCHGHRNHPSQTGQSKMETDPRRLSGPRPKEYHRHVSHRTRRADAQTADNRNAVTMTQRESHRSDEEHVTMDERRFDRLARSLARSQSRRQWLRSALAGSAAIAAT